MVPNPYETEPCGDEIELPILLEDGEEISVIHACVGKRNHKGLHHDWHETDGVDGALIVWPVEEDIDEDIDPDELA